MTSRYQTESKNKPIDPNDGALSAAPNKSPKTERPELGAIRRFLLALLGLLLVLLAAIGVVLPGIPTTGPLILASICLTKSSPRLERMLVRSRFFSPFHRYLDGQAEMPWRAKVIAIGMMWTAIILSSLYLWKFQDGPLWLVGLIVGSGFVGTVVISRFRRINVISSAALERSGEE
ncbi:MAG: DUF454 domain-containing protein [Planctomycetaceae bacterium]|nr:DUF454 domain-containing protein [Planctomycetaceae bacterium]